MSRAAMAALAALLAVTSCIYPFPSQEQHYYGAEECPPESEQPEPPPVAPGPGLMMMLPDGHDSATPQPLTTPLPMQCAKCDRVVIHLPDRIERKLDAGEPINEVWVPELARMALADADPEERAEGTVWLAWMRFARANASALRSKDPLSAGDMQKLLDEYRAYTGAPKGPLPTSAQVVSDPARRRAWNRLPRHERELWAAYLDRYGNTADVTVSEDLRITDQVKLGMALRIMPRYLRSGAHEALQVLVNDPVFQMSTVLGITAYLALLVAPEPIFTKGMAVLTTAGIMMMCGATVQEIWTLAAVWMQLREQTEQASTLAEIEAAAATFGRSLGGSGARLLVAVSTIVAGKALVGRPAVGTSKQPPLAPVLAGPRGSALATVGLELRLTSGPSVTLAPAPLAMAAVKGRSGKGGGSSGKGKKGGGAARPLREPGKWVPSKTAMSPRAAKYQKQVTGRPVTEEYRVGGVKFDGYKDGVLLDAKGPGYKNFADRRSNYRKWAEWFKDTGKDGLVREAMRQVDAAKKAGGVSIEWHIAEKEMLGLFRGVIEEARAAKIIKLKYVPAKP